MENTGDTYQCNKCDHVWSYEDDACPDCGSSEFRDVVTELTNTESRDEDFCQECQGKNPTWYAPQSIWKLLYPNEGIVCPSCFEEEADLKGIKIMFKAEIL